MERMPEILQLRDVSRRFGATTVLDKVNITIGSGSFTALLGASGCGKSTTLRIMAGLDRPSSGDVLLAGSDVSGLSAYERNVAMVFQSYALYPHLTVAQNIALPLTMRHLSPLGRIPLLGALVPGTGSARRTIATKVEEAAAALVDYGRRHITHATALVRERVAREPSVHAESPAGPAAR